MCIDFTSWTSLIKKSEIPNAPKSFLNMSAPKKFQILGLQITDAQPVLVIKIGYNN